MLQLRMIVPSQLRERVAAVLDDPGTSVSNVIVVPHAGTRPVGDLVICDVHREDANAVIGRLQELHVDEAGSIAVVRLDLQLSAADRRRVAHSEIGGEDDAVVWEELQARTSDEVHLSGAFLTFMAVATLIASVGIVLDQPILIVGAMVVGPDFGPLAAMAVGIVRRRRSMVWRAARTLAAGFAFGIAAAALFSLVMIGFGQFPADTFSQPHPATGFIWRPDQLSAVVGFLAGIAGVLSLTSAKSGALVGVLISVTTVPAAAAIALAVASGEWGQAGWSGVQLLVNIIAIVAGGVLTLLVQLAVQRAVRRRRDRAAHVS